jgi:hypothetical protein
MTGALGARAAAGPNSESWAKQQRVSFLSGRENTSAFFFKAFS